MDQAVAPVTRVRDEIDAAKKQPPVPASCVMQHATELVGGINTTISEIDTISSTYLQPLRTFNDVFSTVSNVLYRMVLGMTSRLTFIPRFIPTLRWRWGFSPVPLRCVFWSAMTRISHHCQVIIAQVNLDHSVFCLLSKVQSVYEFLLEDGTKAILDVMKDTLARITQVVSSCAQFIKNYSETKMLCMPLQILP